MRKTALFVTVNRPSSQYAPAAASTVFFNRFWKGWMALCLLLLAAIGAQAQTASFSYVITTLGGGFNNPSGVAKGRTLAEAYFRANKADRVAAFGGCIALNREVDLETARLVAEKADLPSLRQLQLARARRGETGQHAQQRRLA